ncbi:MAG: RusA family crossover junction endodeoxyribonuclease [Patescibacteria group bacterium]|jgi:Holliday junction resolvase RusA-like endonuclease
MSKKYKITGVDLDFGIGQIIPATQEAYQVDQFSGQTRKIEKESLGVFKHTINGYLDKKLADSQQFPTSQELFVFVIQYFASTREYQRRDIDNMAKTILDVLKQRCYYDDSQVKTLLVGKKIEKRVPQNFAYVAIKMLHTEDVDAMKISGLERSVTMFQELKSKGVL